jgi:GT2 family glycosyltransferase
MPNPDFSICILTYSKPHLLDARLSELEGFASGYSVEVCILDNGGQRGAAQLVISRHIGPKTPLRSFRLADNIGFGGGFNHLVAQSKGDRLVLLSDDVEVSGDFLGPLTDALEEEPTALLCHRVIDWPAGWNQFGDVTFPYPEGYFLAMDRRTWILMGGFDPRFHPHDYEDVDLGMKAKEHGIPILPMPSLPLLHRGAGTIGQSSSRYENTISMRARFAEKWNIPNLPVRP